MPALYNYYDGDNYSLKLINSPIGSGKQTSISLGDDNTKIYTQSTGNINFSTNISIDQNLTVGTSISPKILYVYSQVGVNTSSIYTNIINHIKNSTSASATSPPSFNNTDLLLLENATGSFLQFLSNASTTSGIGFSTSSSRNKGSITYNYSSDTMTFTANASSMTFATSGTLTVPALAVSGSMTVTSTITVPTVISSVNSINVPTIVSGTGSVTADFTSSSIILVKFGSTSSSTITLTVPVSISPHRMRVLYLLVKSNGNYSISSSTTGGTGAVRLPSDYAISPSANNRYDLYSFLSNGQDLFCTFAYNYNFNSSGPLN
jgi:hypothetical protein